MAEDSAAPQSPKTRQGDIIIPPTMVARNSSKARSLAEAKEPKRVGLRAYVVLIALTLLAFAPILKSDLLWSEFDEVARTPFASMEDWQEAWQVEAIRRHDPITLTSYFVESYLPLPPATTHRLINLFLHLTAALLLLKVLESLKLRGAYASALVFALHPAVLQALYWPGYRNELVGLVFILASLYFGIRNRDARDFILMLVLSLIGSLLHPAALVLPALLGLVILFQHKTFHLHHYNRVLPLACVALFVGVWTQSGQSGAARPEEINLLTQAGQNLYFYLRQALLPLDLSLFHPFTEGQSYNVGATNSLLAFLIFIPFYVLIAFNFRQGWARGIFLGLTSFLLLLIYGITQTGHFIDGNLAKEDYGLYVALPAVLALTFCSAAGFFGRKQTLGKFLWPTCFSLFLVVHLGMTASFSYAVSDSTRMWQSLAEQWEKSWQPKAALLASVRSTDSDLLNEQKIIRTLEEILAINPERHEDRIDLARRYREAKQTTNAVREYQRILRETQPSDKFLKEAADFFDRLNLRWEASNARERIGSSPISQE